MFSPFIVLLSFSKSLATECLFLNDEQSIVRPTLIDINPHELKYYPFMISLNKCAASCNVLSLKICVPRETKTINVKAFDMITNKDEAKAITKHVSCNFKCKSDSATCKSKQKWNNKTCQYELKNYHKYEKDYISRTCENTKYIKSVAETC